MAVISTLGVCQFCFDAAVVHGQEDWGARFRGVELTNHSLTEIILLHWPRFDRWVLPGLTTRSVILFSNRTDTASFATIQLKAQWKLFFFNFSIVVTKESVNRWNGIAFLPFIKSCSLPSIISVLFNLRFVITIASFSLAGECNVYLFKRQLLRMKNSTAQDQKIKYPGQGSRSAQPTQVGCDIQGGCDARLSNQD